MLYILVCQGAAKCVAILLERYISNDMPKVTEKVQQYVDACIPSQYAINEKLAKIDSLRRTEDEAPANSCCYVQPRVMIVK